VSGIVFPLNQLLQALIHRIADGLYPAQRQGVGRVNLE